MDKPPVRIPEDYPYDLQSKILGYVPGATNAIVRGDKDRISAGYTRLQELCIEPVGIKEFKKYVHNVASNFKEDDNMAIISFIEYYYIDQKILRANGIPES